MVVSRTRHGCTITGLPVLSIIQMHEKTFIHVGDRRASPATYSGYRTTDHSRPTDGAPTWATNDHYRSACMILARRRTATLRVSRHSRNAVVPTHNDSTTHTTMLLP